MRIYVLYIRLFRLYTLWIKEYEAGCELWIENNVWGISGGIELPGGAEENVEKLQCR